MHAALWFCVLGGWKGLVELCRASLALFDVCFSINVKRVSLHVCFQLEVSQLEGSLQQPKAQSAMSPYLVPDTQALCQHLALVKQLATSGRFIIIIPRTGMGTPQQVIGSGCLPLSLLCWEQAPEAWVVPFPPPALILHFIWNSCNTLLMCSFGACSVCGPCLRF